MQISIDNTTLDNLIEQAKVASRLRANLDLRNSPSDTSQRMLNAIEPGSVVPIHRHQNTSETMVILRGSVIEEFYNDEGVCIDTYEVSPTGPVLALNIPAGQWHTLRALESGTVILEMKDGVYEPIADCDVMNR